MVNTVLNVNAILDASPFSIGDRVRVKDHIDTGYHGSYYGGDVGTVRSSQLGDALDFPDSIRVTFDENEDEGEDVRYDYIVRISELELDEAPVVEGQEPGLI